MDGQPATSPRPTPARLRRHGQGHGKALATNAVLEEQGKRKSYLAVASIGRPSMVTKAEDFNEWYNEVVDKAGLTDKRYPIKGMSVWAPYDWAVSPGRPSWSSVAREPAHRTVHSPFD